MSTITLSSHQLSTLADSPLFANIKRAAYPTLFEILHCHQKSYEKDEILLHMGDSFSYAGIVLEGSVESSFFNENFDKINVNHFTTGQLFGEALACKQIAHSPVQLRAVTSCTILYLDLHALLQNQTLTCNCQQQFSLNLIQILATQNVFSNLKLRILSQKSLRARIYVYLSSLPPDADQILHIPFSQTSLAEFLGVNRSALSRELGRMQDEGILQIRKREVRILTPFD